MLNDSPYGWLEFKVVSGEASGPDATGDETGAGQERRELAKFHELASNTSRNIQRQQANRSGAW